MTPLYAILYKLYLIQYLDLVKDLQVVIKKLIFCIQKQCIIYFRLPHLNEIKNYPLVNGGIWFDCIYQIVYQVKITPLKFQWHADRFHTLFCKHRSRQFGYTYHINKHSISLYLDFRQSLLSIDKLIEPRLFSHTDPYNNTFSCSL